MSTEERIQAFRKTYEELRSEIGKVIVGHDEIVENTLIALFAGGHVLLEGVPGLGKTLLVRTLSEVFDLSFKRIQFTPDLLPGDITGGYVFESEHNRFMLRKGPIFANILLADEINRASPKTQSALLEAMQEYQVTLEGETLALVEPFIVIATQNPIEYEGTFPLPEAQLDRFIVKLSIGYPTPEEEDEILKRRAERKKDIVPLQAVISPKTFLEMRAAVEEVYVDPDVRRYMVDLAAKSRYHRQVAVGVSPRGSLALLKLTRAWAAIQGRSYVVPDDIKQFIQPALAHRIILDPSLWDTKKSENTVIAEITQSVAVPVLRSEHE